MSIPTSAKSILDFIGEKEAPRGYDDFYRRSKLQPPKPLSSMTVGEVLAWQEASVNAGSKSSAAGRYQIIRKTLRGLVNKGVVGQDELFTEATQDALGFELMRGRGWDAYSRGEMSEIEFGNNIAKEWASMPMLSGPKTGLSYYDGDGLNQNLTNAETFLTVLRNTSAQPEAGPAPEPPPVEPAQPPAIETAPIGEPSHQKLTDPRKEVGVEPAGSPAADAPGFRSPLPRGDRPYAPNSFLGDVFSEFSDSGVVRAITSIADDLDPFGLSPRAPDDPGFDFSKAKGYAGNERHWAPLSKARNQEQFDRILRDIRQEEIRRTRVETGGRFLAPLIGGLVQPETIASMMLIPGSQGLGFLKSSTTIGAKTLAFEGTAEMHRQSRNPVATAGEGVMRVASATLLAGGIAGGLGMMGKREAAALAKQFDEDVTAMSGISPSSSLETGRGPIIVEYGNDLDGTGAGRSVVMGADARRVAIDGNRVAEEWRQMEWRKYGLEDDEFPTPNHWAEFRARLEVAEREDELPFGREDFDVPESIIVNGQKVAVKQVQREGAAAAAINVKEGIMEIDPERLTDLFFKEAWTSPRKLSDGSRAQPLPYDQFETLDDWVNFVINHELSHIHVKRGPGETLGAYEDRVNAFALQSKVRYTTRPMKAKIEAREVEFMRNRLDSLEFSKFEFKNDAEHVARVEAEIADIKARLAHAGESIKARVGNGTSRAEQVKKALEQAASEGGSKAPPPPPPVERALADYRKWNEGNRRQAKKHLAKVIDRMVDSPYKRVHRNALNGQTINLMDILGMDGGLQTLAMQAGQTPGASIDTMAKLWEWQTHKLKDAQTGAYEKYLGFTGNARLTDIPLRQTAAQLRQLVTGSSKRADGQPALKFDDFSRRASVAVMTGKPDEIVEINEFANAIRAFYKEFHADAVNTNVMGNMTPNGAKAQVQHLNGFIGREPRPVDPNSSSVPPPPSGLWAEIEAAFSDAKLMPQYNDFVDQLHAWRKAVAPTMEMRQLKENTIRGAMKQMDQYDLNEIVKDPKLKKEMKQLLLDAGIADADVDTILKNLRDKPRPPFDMGNPEHRLLDDILRDTTKRRAAFRQIASEGGIAKGELIEEDFFSRVWRTDSVVEHADLLKTRVIIPHLMRQGATSAEAATRADGIIEELSQAPVPLPGKGSDTIPSAMKRRAIDIPNSLLVDVKTVDGKTIDFIETDPMAVASSYQQRVGPYIELARRFNTMHEFGADKKRLIPDNPHTGFNVALLDTLRAEKKKFGDKPGWDDHWAPIERDILFMKDRVLHATMTEPWRRDNRAASVLKDWATLVFMGKASISTLPDMAKIQMAHGLDEVTRFAALQLDAGVRDTMRALNYEARAAAALTDVALGGLMKRFSEVGTDPAFLSRPEKLLRGATNRYFILNGLGPITYSMRTLDGTIRSHKIFADAVAVAKGEGSKEQISFLAQYGINANMAKRIAKMADDGHAKFDDQAQVWNPASDNWTDKDAVRAYRSAIRQGVDNTILVASAADKPIAIDGVVHFRKGNKTIDGIAAKNGWIERGDYWRVQSGILGLPFQFWNYSMAATNKIGVAGVENPDKNFLMGAATMLGMGYIAMQLRTPEWSWNQMSTADKIARIVDQSGMTGVMSEYAYMFQNGFAGITGTNPYPINYRWGKAPTGWDAALDFLGPGPSVLNNAVSGGWGLLNGDPKAMRTLGWAIPGRNHVLLSDSINNGLNAVQRQMR